MESGDILRLIVIVAGVFLLFVTVSSLAKRRMTEPFCLTWGLISLIIILAGILLRPTEWNRYISGTGILLVSMIAFCVIFGAYFLSTRVSELMRKNLELAMQVSLLNQEKEEMKQRLDRLAACMEEKGMTL
jgi:fucose 4-O-acetylase-like acetyltransferase